jgi:hypothetical protein
MKYIIRLREAGRQTGLQARTAQWHQTKLPAGRPPMADGGLPVTGLGAGSRSGMPVWLSRAIITWVMSWPAGMAGVAQHDPCRTGTRCPAPGRTRPSPRRAWCCPPSRTLHRARPDSSPAPAATARIIPAATAKAKSRHSRRYHRQSAHPAHGRTAHAVSAIMRAFPRKRLVKSCTKRFRGNVDVAAGNTAIPHATLLAA